MKAVITGHKGFIGSHFLNYASDKLDVVAACDLKDGSFFDLSDWNVVRDLPNCDVLIHLAAINGTRLFYENPTYVTINNTLPTINLVKRYANTPTKLVFASTCEIFNGATDRQIYPVPTDENVPVVFDDIRNPRWSYSVPKALGENLIANAGNDYLILRYFNVYGQGQIDHFIPEFVDRVKHGEYYIVGDDTRSFCYVDDAVKMTHALVTQCSGEIVNVGTSNETKISDVAKLIMEVMGVDPQLLKIFPSPNGSARRRAPDVKKLHKYVRIEETSLYDGIKQTVQALL